VAQISVNGGGDGLFIGLFIGQKHDLSKKISNFLV
jgi:hypothetical protein